MTEQERKMRIAELLENLEHKLDEGRGGYVYLQLFNGRSTPDEDYQGGGPYTKFFGPYNEIQIAFAGDIRCIRPENESVDEDWLGFDDDGMVKYQGIYYSDVAISGMNDLRSYIRLCVEYPDISYPDFTGGV